MGRDFPGAAGDADWYRAGPFKLAYAGLVLTLLAIGFSFIPGEIGTFLSVLLMVAGLLTAGGAVWWRLTDPGADNFEERSQTGVLIALASGSVLFALLGMNKEWDSLQDWMLVLWCVTLAAVPVVMLPRAGRRAVVSCLVLFHFGGILTATTAVPQPGQASPWIPTLVWNNVYRKYLTFAYLNNAYHFYSPEPGPASLVWFLVEFDKGDPEWKRLGQRDEVPTRQQYQRLLSLTESVNQYRPVPYTKMQALYLRRGSAGQLFPGVRIPVNDALTLDQQFREPTDLAKKYLESYARYICRTTESSTNPEAKVKSVKIYRLTHQLISAPQLDSGVSPTDPTLFLAYFFGEYEYLPNGKVKLKVNHSGDKDKPLEWGEMADNGTWVQRTEEFRDPFLYWMLPIVRVPKDPNSPSTNLKDYRLLDTLSIHAGVTIKWDVD